MLSSDAVVVCFSTAILLPFDYTFSTLEIPGCLLVNLSGLVIDRTHLDSFIGEYSCASSASANHFGEPGSLLFHAAIVVVLGDRLYSIET